MDEYVDRKKFENVLKIADSIAKANGKDKDRQIWARAIRLLNDMPTVDVAPVVRCKDCKHSWEDISGLCCSYRVCIDLTVPDDFYCAYAIRKEGE
mgnify:CR=1 FL=1|jgi:hypothetical protein